MNIALMTCNDSNYDVLANITTPTKRKYCEKWGLWYEHVKFANEDPCWAKVRIMSEMLERYDAVLYIDCDAVIVNQDFNIIEFLENTDKEKQLIYSTDLNGINAGSYIARTNPKPDGTDLIKQFFFCLRTWGPMFYGGHPWKDQSAMKYWLYKPPYDQMGLSMPQNFMNSYINETFNYTGHPFPSYIQGDYKEGDWIVHLPGLPMEIRGKYLKEKFGLEQ